jgi:hypothetical protein
MEVILVISVIAIYLYYRYRKNQWEITTGLVQSNLTVYKNSINRGNSSEAALKWMIESRYLNSLVYTPQQSNEIITQLKYRFEANKNIMDEKAWVLEILTRMYEIENVNLPDGMKSKHIIKIINEFHKYWRFNLDT